MKTGMQLIQDERAEQITKHGRTVERDRQENSKCQLYDAAKALEKRRYLDRLRGKPKGWDAKTWERMVGKCRVECLTIAGALLMAENERRGLTIHNEVIAEFAKEIDRLYSDYEKYN